MTKKKGIDCGIPHLWAIIPAAGRGLRMNSDIPKQHMPLCGKSVLHHTLSRLCDMEEVRGIAVGLSSPDPWWEQGPFDHPKLLGTYPGGERRQDTVLNGLRYLAEVAEVGPSQQVLVHDAARPCITRRDVFNVAEKAHESENGAVLGSRVKDTIKTSSGDDAISGTLDRSCCWRAYTPQVFALGKLLFALETAREKGVTVTDEAMAMELVGLLPCMVQGSDMNIKITENADLRLAGFFLEAEIDE